MKLANIALSALLLVGVGCAPKAAPTVNTNVSGGANTSTNTQTEDIAISIDGTWELQAFTAPGKTSLDASELGATMTVEEGAKLSAKICNSMSGAYDIEAGMLSVAALMSTKMACEGLAGDAEAAFTQGLTEGMTMKLDGSTLTLRSKSGAEFVFARAADNGRMGAPTDDEEPSEDRSYVGVITSIDLEKMMVDGPAYIVIKTDANATATILVPSMGLGLCKARASIADVYALKVGQKVEARGSIGSETNSIVPCQSSEHYLRVVAGTR